MRAAPTHVRLYGFVRGDLSSQMDLAGAHLIAGPPPLGALFCEAHPGSAPDAKEALEHDEALRRAMDRFDAVLPVRFGQLLEAGELLPLLREHRDEIDRELSRLAGTCELALRFALPREGPQEPSSGADLGTRYIERKLARAELGALETATAPLREQIASLSRETLRSWRATDEIVELSACFLVDRARQAEHRAAASSIVGEADRLGISALWMGPWAPYSFVRLQLSHTRR